MAVSTVTSKNTVTFSLPAQTSVGFTAVANSAAQQFVTFQIGNNAPVSWSGKGTGNVVFGTGAFNTPPSSTGEVTCSVTISHGDSSSPEPSQVSLSSFITENMKLKGFVVASEDSRGNDFNDAILYINIGAK